MDSETLITLAADIVSAHVSYNNVASGDLPNLIQSVYGALAAAGQPVEAAPEVLTPAVSVRSSIKPDAITCLECGTKLKMLKRHLTTDHGLTPAEYRARWGLGADYPLVAPNYSETRKQLAVKIGLGRKMGQKMAPKPAAAKAGPAKPAAAKRTTAKAVATKTAPKAAAAAKPARRKKATAPAQASSVPAQSES